MRVQYFVKSIVVSGFEPVIIQSFMTLLRNFIRYYCTFGSNHACLSPEDFRVTSNALLKCLNRGCLMFGVSFGNLNCFYLVLSVVFLHLPSFLRNSINY